MLFGEEQELSFVVKLMVHVSDSCVTQDTMFAHTAVEHKQADSAERLQLEARKVIAR